MLDVFKFLFWEYPKWIWYNRKICPLYDYPYCKANSLVTCFNKPCGLGNALYSCLHFRKYIPKEE